MLVLDENHIKNIGTNWNETIAVIEEAVKCLASEDYAQPIKPYLRYRDLKNRIIAMPAFVGGNINMAGIKWISSFPDNIKKGIPRAHSVAILNDANTGEPMAIINTALLSVIRTASVSGFMLKHFDDIRDLENIKIGIIGFGPIGQYHLKMCQAVLGNRIDKISIYDLRSIDVSTIEDASNVQIVDSWEEAYHDADIFITCTVSDAPYIDKAPKSGSLHLNTSLRDYKVDVYDWFKDGIIVDDWEEVCRQATDIEMMHLEKGLNEEDTSSITDLIDSNVLKALPKDQPILFNPMGMAVFDIAIGNFYYQTAKNGLLVL